MVYSVSTFMFLARMGFGVVLLTAAPTKRHCGVAFVRCLPLALLLFTASCGGSGSSGGGGGKGGNSPGVTFLPAVAYYSGGANPFSVVVADVNGDKKPDLVVANFGCGSGITCGSVGILAGKGDGTFQAAVVYPSGGCCTSSVAVADVNGDGRPDLVVATGCASTCVGGAVSVLLGNGDGTFQTATLYGSGGIQPMYVAVTDVNGDGRPDVLVANGLPCQTCVDSTVGVLLGNGDGTFQPAATYDSGGVSANALSVADLNGDGKPDLAVTNACNPGDSSCSAGYADYLTVLIGNGDGTFQRAVNYGSGGSRPASVAIADINGDGKPDLLVSNFYCGNFCNHYPSGSVGVLLGNGDGTFQAVVNYDAGGLNAGSIAVADVDGDGKLDVVVVNNGKIGNSDAGNGVGLLLGNGDGTLQAVVTYASGPYTSEAVAVAEVNRDGEPDLVVASWSADGAGSVSVLLNAGKS